MTAADFPLRPLGQIAENHDAKRRPVKASNRRPGPYPYYGAQGIVDHVEEYLFDGEFVLVAEDGENLRSRKEDVALLANGKFWVNNHAHILRGSSVTMTRFLLYAINQADISGYVTGSTIPKLSQGSLNRILLPCPPIGIQKSIVDLLGALDDKIELNRRMNETLEAMARAIFRDWFVDFGPTRARMEGRAPYLAPDIWTLFPDRLDDDGKPKEWRSEPLDGIADFLNGLALQKFPPVGQDDLPVIKIAQLRTGSADGGGLAASSIPARYVVEDGDVLFSWSGSLTQVVWTGGRGALNQHLFKVTSDHYQKWLHYFWVDYHLPEFQAIAASKATTMGHIQRHHLSEAATMIGSDGVMAAADSLLAPLFDRMIANALENRTLAATRDLLLPKLMSGEIRIRDAEAMIADAA